MTRRREEPLLSRAEPGGASRNGGTPTGTLQAPLLPTTHLAAQEAAVSELAQEEGDEEGPQHEDEGQQSRVGLVPRAGRPLSGGQGTRIQVQLRPQGSLGRVEWQQRVLREDLGGLRGCPGAHLGR